MNWLASISEAARRGGVSRRTVERWIAEHRLKSEPHPTDKRVKLVPVEDVIALAGGRRGDAGNGVPNVLDNAETSVVSGGDRGETAVALDRPRDYQDVNDQALQLVYSHMHRLISQVFPEMFQPLTLEQLRCGPLGEDLSRLARLANGQIRESKETVLEAIEAVLQLLFWPAAADDYTVPLSFWDTDLGRMLALAKYRGYEPAELVSIGSAANMLGVTRATVYKWMEDRTLNYVRDDMSGRTFVVRRDVEHVIRVARELTMAHQRKQRREQARRKRPIESPATEERAS